MRPECTAIHESLKSGQITGFFCETIVTVEGQPSPARIERAVDLGLRILSAPRAGSSRIDDPTGELYAKDADEAMRLGRYESIAGAIEARGLGFARKQKVDRAQAPAATRKVARAIAEWADGDSVAAHYGYANDLFCTQDRAVRAGRDSVMHPAHRGWLRRAYGVEFASIAGLAMLLRPATRD